MDRDHRDVIPLIDVGHGGPVALFHADRPRAEALLAIARRRYGRLALSVGDRASRAWLRRNTNPYGHEIEAIAAGLGAAGAIMLNFSFEWGCSALVEPEAGGMRLLRVLDWRLDGLGRNAVVAKLQSPAGPYYNVTWPGAVGVLTGMAPGRFSAAIHQAPMRRHGLTKVGDWAKNRALVWRRNALAPAHLLRFAFETCRDYAAARRLLTETPVALPAIFVLAGTETDAACVIERLEDRAIVHDGGPAAVANRWRHAEAFDGGWSWRGRENDSRLACMSGVSGRAIEGFSWLVPPVLNRDTRLAVRCNAATGELAVLGYEQMRPATEEFSLHHKDLAAA